MTWLKKLEIDPNYVDCWLITIDFDFTIDFCLVLTIDFDFYVDIWPKVKISKRAYFT